MSEILAIYGSPRRKGNTATLLMHAVRGARNSGAEVKELVLRDLEISPCLEIYECAKTGRCAIQDDFQTVYDDLLKCEGLMLASPIFFYTVSAHTKILMDRCQSFWARKYLLGETLGESARSQRKGLFISVGATKGKKLFDGPLLSIRYLFDVLGMELWRTLLYRGLDFEGDVFKYPSYLEEAYKAGKELARSLRGSGAMS